MTPDLARDLANDVLTLTASSRPFLRKKAIIVMYKVFLKVGLMVQCTYAETGI